MTGDPYFFDAMRKAQEAVAQMVAAPFVSPFPEMDADVDKLVKTAQEKAQPVPRWVLYVMVRPLHSMNKGKAMAQTGHACCDFAFKYGECDEAKEWRQQSNQKTFGTQLNVKWNEDIIDTIEECDSIISGFVVDDTYPYRVPNAEIQSLIDDVHHTDTPTLHKDGSWTCYRKETTAYYFLSTKAVCDMAGFKMELED